MIGSSRFRRIAGRVARIAVLLVVMASLLWFFGSRMPGRNISNAAAVSATELALRDELRADVEKLAGEIGERNMNRYPRLLAAAEFIEASFASAGYAPRRDTYELRGRACHNLEVE